MLLRFFLFLPCAILCSEMADAQERPDYTAGESKWAEAQRKALGLPETPAPPPQTNAQQLQDYLTGKRSFTPEQMTELLNNTSRTHPTFDQSGAIYKTFKDLVDSGNLDAASRFIQSLRPSYNNLRAMVIAA
jgi:hypothetical protein